jgi:NAD+ diphosphatase
MINEIFPDILDMSLARTGGVRGDDLVLCFRDNSILLKDTGTGYEIPVFKDLKNVPGTGPGPRFLFSLNSTGCFLLDEQPAEEGRLQYRDIWVLRSFRKKALAWAGAVGHQLYTWHNNNRFCGRCGSKTVVKTEERAIECPACRNTVYPAISPAIIIAITCKDRILLAKGKHYRGNFYALIAGYSDIGESLEETIAREVKEEVGLEVKNIRYYKSQPWPFSGSLMIGYFAEADDSQPLTINEDEIETAAWFTRGSLPEHAANISISGDMIDAFENGLS